METLILIVAGGLGALTKDIVKDNRLVLPKYQDGAIVLGFIGGVIIGASVGYLVDQNPTTAFLAGYAGYQIIESLVPKNERK